MTEQTSLPASAPLAGNVAPAQHGAVATPAPAAAISVQRDGGKLSKLQELMKDANSVYWKGADAEKNQARYRELVGGAPEQAQPDQPQPMQPAIEHKYEVSQYVNGDNSAR